MGTMNATVATGFRGHPSKPEVRGSFQVQQHGGGCQRIP